MRLMTNVSGTALSLAALVSLPFAAMAQEETPGYLQKDLADLAAMLEGRWDNDRANFFAKDAGQPVSDLAPRQHLVIRSIEADAADGTDGSIMLHARRNVEGGGNSVLRHRLVTDPAEGHIRQDILADDTAEPLADCAIHWQRAGDGFSGRAEGRECIVLFPRPAATDDGEPLQVNLTLSDTAYWVNASRGVSLSSARFRRARAFECWTAVMRGAQHGDSGEGMDDWQFQTGVMLHDQGGEAVLTTDETPPRTVRLKLRDVDWTYGDRRPSLTLYAYEGEKRPRHILCLDGGRGGPRGPEPALAAGQLHRRTGQNLRGLLVRAFCFTRFVDLVGNFTSLNRTQK